MTGRQTMVAWGDPRLLLRQRQAFPTATINGIVGMTSQPFWAPSIGQPGEGPPSGKSWKWGREMARSAGVETQRVRRGIGRYNSSKVSGWGYKTS
jgi:hypothetical protein